jgi:hypothetical protein
VTNDWFIFIETQLNSIPIQFNSIQFNIEILKKVLNNVKFQRIQHSLTHSLSLSWKRIQKKVKFQTQSQHYWHIFTLSNWLEINNKKWMWNMYYKVGAIDSKFEWQIECNLHIEKTLSSWIEWMCNDWIEWNNLQLDISSNCFVILEFWTENRLASSMTKLTSLLHLSLNDTKIQSDTMVSVLCQLPSLQVLELDIIQQLETIYSITNLSSHLTWTSLTFIKWNHINSNTNWISHSITHTLDLSWCDSLNNIPTELEYLTNLRNFRLSGRKKNQ